MAATKGQPAPKPSSLKDPVPGQEAVNDLEAYAASYSPPEIATPEQTVNDLDQYSAPSVPAQQESFPGADYLPTVGGIIGGIAGSAAGGVGAVPGAALGAAGGQSLRRLIEINILNQSTKGMTPQSELLGSAKEGLKEGAGQLVGGAVLKGLGYGGSKIIGLADDAVKGVKNVFSEARDTLEEPILKFISERASSLTPQASGDAVKGLLKENIKTKYGPFIKAYGELDEIGSALPLKDEARRSLTQKIREWSASELGGDNARVVRKFVDDLDAASNGRQFRNVISQIGDAKSTAFQSGATQQAQVLKELQTRANDFMENETTKLASRIAGGKAAPNEVAFLDQILKTKGIQEADPAKYAKSLAGDYLKNLRSVKTDYSGFKSFLEDVAEQTKVKSSNKGPMTFIDDIDSVPSEKLIERMFDPKNVAALKKMKAETPEVFDEVAKARLRNITQKSSPDGTLDLFRLQKEINKLPPDTRNLLFSAEELGSMNKILSNPKLMKLKALEQKLDNQMLSYVKDISSVVAEKAPAALKVPLRQAVGKSITTPAEIMLNRRREEE